MTAKRFNLVGGYLYDYDECVSHFDDPKHREEIVNLLNKLSDENECLKSRVNYFEMKIQRERRASMVQYDKWENEALDKINELSDENEQLKHDATVLIHSNSDYRKENRQLKAQLYCESDSVCSICKHQKLLKSDIDGYYIAKCEKGYEECSKIDLKHCNGFELKKSCFNCKYFKEKKLYKDGRTGFRTDLKKCKWEYMYYEDTKEQREFFRTTHCNNWELKE